MALFKYSMVPAYNIICYLDDMLVLHCAKNDSVHAPFDGKFIIHEDGVYELASKYNSLFIKNIDANEKLTDKFVKAGSMIGTVKAGTINHETIGYIQVDIKDGNILEYLYMRDIEPVEIEKIEEEKVVEEQPKKTTKSTNKKVENK